jgi:hypothetical protein
MGFSVQCEEKPRDKRFYVKERNVHELRARRPDRMNLTEATPKLLFSNVPPDCHDDYLWAWVEARGYRVSSLKLIRDQVTGTSPSFAHVQLMNSGKIEEAERSLNGQDLRGQRVQVARILARTA